MIFTRVATLGYVPWILVGATIYGLAAAQAIVWAKVRSVTPTVMVPGATRSEVVAPMRITEDYLVGVAETLMRQHFNWTSDTYRQTVLRTASFVDRPILRHFQTQWLANAHVIEATGEGQFALVGRPVVVDFHPDIGGSLIVPVRVEKFIRGLPYREMDYRVLLTLTVRRPNGRYPYAVRIAAMQVENLTQEVQE